MLFIRGGFRGRVGWAGFGGCAVIFDYFCACVEKCVKFVCGGVTD